MKVLRRPLFMTSNALTVSSQTRDALADQVVIGACNFLTNIMVGRSLVPDAFGLYILALNLLYLVKGLQEAIVAAPFGVHRQHRGGDDLVLYRGSNASLHVVTTGVVMVLVLLVGRVVETEEVGQAALMALVAIPFLLTREYLRRVSFAEFRSSLALSMDVVAGAVQVGAVALLWHQEWLTAFRVFTVMAAACGLGVIAWRSLAAYPMQVARSRLLADWRTDLQFGRWSGLTFLLGCSTPHLVPWLLATRADNVAVARYGAAFMIVGFANLWVLGVNNFLYPLAAKSYQAGGTRKLKQTLGRASLLFATLLGAFCLLLWLAGDLVLGPLLAYKYLHLKTTMTLLGVVVLCGALSMTAGSGLASMLRPQLNLPADAVALLGSLGLAIVLIPAHGEVGAASALVAGVGAGGLTRWAILIAVLRAWR